MRTGLNDALSDHEELLTTGEAAKLLNSSRQHVVDLCERGELPYSTVGAHRRVKRSDVEAVKIRTQRLTRDQRRSLWLAYATAGRIVENPDHARALAHQNIDHKRGTTRGQARRWMDEWQELLGGPIEHLLEVLVSPSPRSRELRQNSPFAGLLSDEERTRILSSWDHSRTTSR
jgi:excisionase family DNA binding protein